MILQRSALLVAGSYPISRYETDSSQNGKGHSRMRLEINDLICSFEDETCGREKLKERMFAKPPSQVSRCVILANMEKSLIIASTKANHVIN